MAKQRRIQTAITYQRAPLVVLMIPPLMLLYISLERTASETASALPRCVYLLPQRGSALKKELGLRATHSREARSDRGPGLHRLTRASSVPPPQGLPQVAAPAPDRPSCSGLRARTESDCAVSGVPAGFRARRWPRKARRALPARRGRHAREVCHPWQFCAPAWRKWQI
jgi:hypothetical protein